MKKIILTIVTIISTICLALSIAGCNSSLPQSPPNGDNPSTQQPIEGDTTNKEDNGEGSGNIKPQFKIFNLYSYGNLNFSNFYKNEIAGVNAARLYLLNIDVTGTSYGYPTSVILYGSDLNENIVATELANIYVDEFGTGMNSDLDTGINNYSFSLKLDFLLLSDNYIKQNDFKIEFTEFSESVNLDYKLKIYDGNNLIAKGEYEQTLDIPKEWIENYLTNNLI